MDGPKQLREAITAPNLLFRWVYDSDLYETETDAMLTGPLAGVHFWRSSFDDIPQLFVEFDEPHLVRGPH